MKRIVRLAHEFVELIPEKLDDGKLYVSIPYATAAHKCCCGCGNEVNTPISPTDWLLIFDGDTVSLNPSIGNWSLECQSHYWIVGDKVEWAGRWSKEKIEVGRSRDRRLKERYFQRTETLSRNGENERSASQEEDRPEEKLWRRLLKPLSNKQRKG